MGDTVSFTQMKDGTKEEYELLHKLEKPFLALTADRVLEELRRQEHVTLEGYRITRLEHGLQSATRAERDGADIDWIVAALLHDIGDGLAPQNHDRMSAEVIRPFVRWDVAWVVEHHGIFQMLYYAHHYGWDRNARTGFATIRVSTVAPSSASVGTRGVSTRTMTPCRLSHFEPMVREVFGRKAYDPGVIREGHVSPLTS
jgi:predicted HD phosphohydrolase